MRTISRFVVTLLVTVSLVGCGGRAANIAVTADDTMFNTIEGVKLTKDTHCDAGNIPAEACKTLAALYVPVWDNYLVVNKALAEGTPLDNIQANVNALKSSGAAFRQEVERLKDGAAKTILLQALIQALSRF